MVFLVRCNNNTMTVHAQLTDRPRRPDSVLSVNKTQPGRTLAPSTRTVPPEAPDFVPVGNVPAGNHMLRMPVKYTLPQRYSPVSRQAFGEISWHILHRYSKSPAAVDY
ncbi:hypothetical protein BJF84_27440 [Rhodococcus sp. CUA-806]|nr:hypothetical protein BJF84_27440 [Rhodococcus sp. CUA-806]